MTRCIVLALACCLCVVSTAQHTGLKNAIQSKVNLIDYRQPNGGEFRPGQGFEFGFYHNVSPYLNLGVPVKAGLPRLVGQRVNTLVGSIDAIGQLGLFKPDALLSPYVMGGAGLTKVNGEYAHLQIPVGAGLNVRISQYAHLNIQGEYRRAMDTDRNNLQIGLGYVYLLHKTAVVPTPTAIDTTKLIDENKVDTDADGTPDVLDLCPNQAGPGIALGCPDADLDSIADYEDRCPNLAGSLLSQGCPDTDGDGTVDIDDKCPNEYGTARGCPDKDGDGFNDTDDQCPDQSGRWNGCPDADFDGVPDKDDKCPKDPGSIENQGCPINKKDTDGDSFSDDVDKCPTVAGKLAGCPDTDGDGWADKDDPCPNAKGTNAPCPDSDIDADGISDHLDKCPNLAGTTANNGCPEVKAEVKSRLEFAKRAVQFETGRATLKGSSFAILDEVYKILVDYPDYKLVISGHTDDIGDENRNLTLSTERARACHDYLMFRGVAQSRLRYLGFGEYRPVAENTTAEGRELNRRVEFEVVFE